MNVTDYSRLEAQFDDYFSSFSTVNPVITRNLDIKYHHSKRVCAAASVIGGGTGLNGEELFLASACGLLHDIGRFDQYVRFGTFADSKSVDHGDHGAEIINTKKWLRFFTPPHDQILISCIRYHNKKNIPDNLTPNQLHYVKLVRDADKSDIYKVIAENYISENPDRSLVLNLSTERKMSAPVIEAILQNQLVDKSLLQTIDDFRLLQLSWIFDFNFAISVRMIEKAGYFSQLLKSLPAVPETKEIEKIINEKIRHILTRKNEIKTL